MHQLVNDNDNFIKMFTRGIKKECSLKETIKMNDKWDEDYKKQGYKFMSSDKIYTEILKILQ